MDFVPVSTDNGSPFTKPRPRYTTKFQKESLDMDVSPPPSEAQDAGGNIF